MRVRFVKIGVDFDYLQEAYNLLYNLVDKDIDLAKDFYNVIEMQRAGRTHVLVKALAKQALVVSVGVAIASIFFPDIRGDIAMASAVGSGLISYMGECCGKKQANKVARGCIEMSDRTYGKLQLCNCKKDMPDEITEEEYISYTTSVIIGLLQNPEFCKKVEKKVKENRKLKNINDNNSEM